MAVYWPVRGHDFVYYDDDHYVTANPVVQSGLSGPAILWAFTTCRGTSTCWHPLTWLSHELDCQLFGLNAGRHHLTSVALHVLNAVLLFLLLRAMTGALWRSAVVAALFAWHPLQVDSVAWIAERKTVLSTLCLLLTMLAYVRYARAPSGWRYALVFLWLCLGLMAKPSLVVVPFLLLVLDYWPLDRMRNAECGVRNAGLRNTQHVVARLVVEKLPLMLPGALHLRHHLDLAGERQGAAQFERPAPFPARGQCLGRLPALRGQGGLASTLGGVLSLPRRLAGLAGGAGGSLRGGISWLVLARRGCGRP